MPGALGQAGWAGVDLSDPGGLAALQGLGKVKPVFTATPFCFSLRGGFQRLHACFQDLFSPLMLTLSEAPTCSVLTDTPGHGSWGSCSFERPVFENCNVRAEAGLLLGWQT